MNLPTSRMLAPLAALLASITSLCVGSSYAKTLFPVVGAQGATTLRQVVAALLLCAFWRPWRWGLARPDAWRIAQYGLALGVMNLCFYLAIARLPLGVAVAIEFTGPLALAMASSRRLLDWAWIGFAVVGLGLLLPLWRDVGALDPVGILCALGAAACWALYIITGQRAGSVHAGQATSLGLVVAALSMLPFGVGGASQVLHSAPLAAAALAVGLLSSALPYSLEMFALKRLPKQTFGILLSLEPAVGALSAWAVLGEVLSPVQWGAIACIMVASAGTALTARV